MKIALDGPSGAGKSSLAKALAAELGLVYVDTGAMYRTVGLFVKREGIDPKNSELISKKLSEINLQLSYSENGQQISLNGEDVTAQIRTPEASMYASSVSSHQCVRNFLLDMQKKLADKGNVIMDGRDIGTVIMPDADVKIYLTASPEARAKRRYKELCEKGQNVTFDDVLADIISRDKNDLEREIAPAVAADDAVLFDNSAMNFEETVKEAVRLIKKTAGKK